MSDPAHDGARDFDFLAGEWDIANRRLRKRLSNCEEWDEFPATLSERPALGGLGSVGEFRAHIGGREVVGLPIRVFHRDVGKWTHHWVDNVRVELEPPLWGAFENGRGVFEGADRHEGRPIRVRTVWTAIADGVAGWEQAFSADDGATWEVNWTMRLTRRAP